MSSDPLLDREVSRRWPAGRHLGLGVLTLLLLVVGLGGWSAFASISGAIVAQGKLKVESERQVVEHPEGGVVKEILVKEGDTVEAGEPLIRLDDTLIAADLAIVEGQLYELMARRGRLTAEQLDKPLPEFDEELLAAGESNPKVAALIEGQRQLFFARAETLKQETDQLRERQQQIREEIVGAQAQQRALVEQVRFVRRELHDLKELQKKGLAQASRVLALEREKARLEGQRGELIANIARLRGQISEIEIQLLGNASTRREDAITQLRDNAYRENEMLEQRNSLLERIDRLEIRAPRPGRVIGMTIFALRSVVRAAEPILYIVPSDAGLIVEAEIETRNVDQVFPGQDARLRFSAFSARTTPDIAATVIQVSPDAFTNEQTGRSYYMTELSINPGEIEKLDHVELLAGMPVEAYIRTGDRSPFSYLTKPFADYFNKAFREE
ncbi:HlyD family type I secretion periplasmic adaptor subunit [Pikeienuella piscinae]|uniref:Membrane fusion protein (MFP) family protein n=1 Tax=Pikeienuella piscinae TaxID=2748098 RepID=A0A7L5C504_9RHOB|nr:HlyD family type I secretion periplasmic adaptor subunit [Pikeienuella piscinae]QIE57039.1 HlyD family type I secretion periplasmic adaptor subunit [Pikeienuella piscinae]